MEISKENVFKVGYAPVIGEKKIKRKKWTSRIIKFIYKNKILTTAAIVFIMCVTLNIILIYNFMRILITAY